MKLNELTALYSPFDQAYAQSMSGHYEDVSYHGDNCTVMAGLKDGQITGFWRPAVAVGCEKELKRQIARLWEISPQIKFLDFLEDGRLSVVSKFLLKKGYVARPYFTQVIDLTQLEMDLKAALRKSYKSLVNKDVNIKEGKIEDYHDVHRRSGGHHRPGRTWHIQSEMIDCGKAFCLTDGPDVAVLIYHNGDCAYYAGGRAMPGKNMHAALWQAIIWARHQGCKTLELGEQVYHVGQMGMDKVAAQKNVDISAFKAGFGSKTVTRLILESK